MDRRRKNKQARRTSYIMPTAAATTTTTPCCSDGESSRETFRSDACSRLVVSSAEYSSGFMWMDGWAGTEASSIEWDFISMSEQEEDLIYRMYQLVGDRWGLIAGRIPGRKAEEIERFWIMRHGDVFAERRMQQQQQQHHQHQMRRERS